MAVIRANTRQRRRPRKRRETNAQESQEEEKVGRKRVRRVHGLRLPGRRCECGKSVEAAANGTSVEAGAAAAAGRGRVKSEKESSLIEDIVRSEHEGVKRRDETGSLPTVLPTLSALFLGARSTVPICVSGNGVMKSAHR